MGYWARIQTDNAYSFYVAPGSLATDFSLIASSNSTSPYYGYGGGNFYQSGTGSSWRLNDGGMYQRGSESDWLDHVALLQVTLPNGYNLPFYVVTVQLPMGASSTPVCTSMMNANAWPPGLSNCWQQNVGNGGIGVQTADGNVYYVNLTPVASTNTSALSVSTSPAYSPAYSANGIAAPSGTYTETCTNISWDGYTLFASCRNDSGQYVSTSIVYDPWDFLPDCTYGSLVTNSNGNLVCN